MKTFDLNSMGLQEMTPLEMKETDGGLICLLIVCVAALALTGCIQNNNTTITFGDGNETKQSSTQVNDSTLNGNMNGNDLKVPIR